MFSLTTFSAWFTLSKNAKDMEWRILWTRFIAIFIDINCWQVKSRASRFLSTGFQNLQSAKKITQNWSGKTFRNHFWCTFDNTPRIFYSNATLASEEFIGLLSFVHKELIVYSSKCIDRSGIDLWLMPNFVMITSTTCTVVAEIFTSGREILEELYHILKLNVDSTRMITTRVFCAKGMVHTF